MLLPVTSCYFTEETSLSEPFPALTKTSLSLCIYFSESLQKCWEQGFLKGFSCALFSCMSNALIFFACNPYFVRFQITTSHWDVAFSALSWKRGNVTVEERGRSGSQTLFRNSNTWRGPTQQRLVSKQLENHEDLPVFLFSAINFCLWFYWPARRSLKH